MFIIVIRRKCGFCLVNCWFCCQDVRISSVKRQGWYCPHCEQYNGFAQVLFEFNVMTLLFLFMLM